MVPPLWGPSGRPPKQVRVRRPRLLPPRGLHGVPWGVRPSSHLPVSISHGKTDCHQRRHAVGQDQRGARKKSAQARVGPACAKDDRGKYCGSLPFYSTSLCHPRIRSRALAIPVFVRQRWWTDRALSRAARARNVLGASDLQSHGPRRGGPSVQHRCRAVSAAVFASLRTGRGSGTALHGKLDHSWHQGRLLPAQGGQVGIRSSHGFDDEFNGKGNGEIALMRLYLTRTGPAKREPTPAEFPVRRHRRDFFRGNSPLPATCHRGRAGRQNASSSPSSPLLECFENFEHCVCFRCVPVRSATARARRQRRQSMSAPRAQARIRPVPNREAWSAIRSRPVTVRHRRGSLLPTRSLPA